MELALQFLAGMLTARQTGTIGSAAISGLIAGVIGGVVGEVAHAVASVAHPSLYSFPGVPLSGIDLHSKVLVAAIFVAIHGAGGAWLGAQGGWAGRGNAPQQQATAGQYGPPPGTYPPPGYAPPPGYSPQSMYPPPPVYPPPLGYPPPPMHPLSGGYSQAPGNPPPPPAELPPAGSPPD